MSEIKPCPTCKGFGYYGDNQTGILYNSEYVKCNCGTVNADYLDRVINVLNGDIRYLRKALKAERSAVLDEVIEKIEKEINKCILLESESWATSMLCDLKQEIEVMKGGE